MKSTSLDNVLPLPLHQYDIDPVTGFLPPEGPLTRLPHQGPFEVWERLIDDLQGLLLTDGLRARVHKLPILDVAQLKTTAEYRRAYVVLTMLAHAYVWGKHEPVSSVLPACLAVPLCKVSATLGIRPVATSASTAIWNWKRLDPEGPYDLSNLMTLHTFSGSIDESWFYLITTAIEARGGNAICAMLAAAQETQSDNPSMERLAEQLNLLADEIGHMVQILNRMYDSCDPYVFFWKVRVYLAGWSNMKEAGLPKGLHYEGVDPPGVHRDYAGASAGQSALMHSLDLGLGVRHSATGTNSGKNQFLLTMREHMPATQRQFLHDLETKTDIRGFIEKLNQRTVIDTATSQAIAAYDRCISQVKQFRDRHIQMVTLYIVMPARKGPVVGGHRSVAGTANEKSNESSHPVEQQQQQQQQPVSHSTPQMTITQVTSTTSTTVSATATTSTKESTFKTSTLYPQAVANTTIPEGTGSDTPDLTATPSPEVSPVVSAVATGPTVSPPRSPPMSALPPSVNDKKQFFGLARPNEGDRVVRGTGGTDVIPFLKQIRDETTAAKMQPYN
ncbi:Indoleamine 2,3-dioxygenase-domain-containing protein [Syncephalis plumigaleata]|nr:Indoleamine 2,3-dioxygenase-domain-containing protein [Syncephalis plumigaleata]